MNQVIDLHKTLVRILMIVLISFALLLQIHAAVDPAETLANAQKKILLSK